MVADSMFYYERKKKSGDILPKIVVSGCVCMWCKESHTTPTHTQRQQSLEEYVKKAIPVNMGCSPGPRSLGGPPSQFSFAFYTGLPTVPYNIESSHI